MIVLSGIEVNIFERRFLTGPNYGYWQRHWPRYPDQTGQVPLIDQFEKPFVELLKAVVQVIRGGNRLYVKY